MNREVRSPLGVRARVGVYLVSGAVSPFGIALAVFIAWKHGEVLSGLGIAVAGAAARAAAIFLFLSTLAASPSIESVP